MGLFILIKTKRGKVIGAVPAKKGKSSKRLISSLRGKFKSGLSFKVVSGASLKNFIKRLKVKKRRVKKKVRRKK